MENLRSSHKNLRKLVKSLSKKEHEKIRIGRNKTNITERTKSK